MRKKKEEEEEEDLLSYKEWWENYLKKVEEFKRNPIIESFKSTEFKKPEPPKAFCEGCHEEYDYDSLDRNMLCEKCVESTTPSNETGVKLGNPEAAFFFANLDITAPEIRIMKSINYLECVGAGDYGLAHCRYDISHLESLNAGKRRNRMLLYRMLFDHYKEKHYDLLKKEHSRFQNLAYSILQELSIFEANRGGTRSVKDNKTRHDRQALAMHNLMKHLQIPLNILAFTLRQNQGVVGNLAFDGIILCNCCYKNKN